MLDITKRHSQRAIHVRKDHYNHSCAYLKLEDMTKEKKIYK